ncbi:MAG: diguanylate cyclase [Elusimicrobiota bacterium]
MSEPKNILLVDDEKLIRYTLSSLLQDEGYAVTTAENGRQAVEQAKNQSFNIAIIDLKLPDIDGIDVLRQVKQTSPEVCAIMITAYATVETAVEAMECEAYDYLTKPFDLNHLKLVIKRGLEKQNLVLENQRLVFKLQNEKEKLEHILALGEKMNSILNLDDLVNFVILRATEILNSKRGSIMLANEKNDTLFIRGSKGIDQNIVKNTKIRYGESIAGRVAREGKPLLVEDIEQDARFGRKNKPSYAGKSFMCVPIKDKEKVTGVISISERLAKNSLDSNHFTEEDLNFFTLIVQHATVSIENAKLYENVSWLAITDTLTGLYNRWYFQNNLGKEVERAQRYQHTLSLIMFDIDYFKKFNDQYGHIAGDHLLRKLAELLKNNARKVDMVCRYGGEEFAIILPDTKLADAQAVAEKIRQAVENYQFSKIFPEYSGSITISAGIAAYKDHYDQDNFVKLADDALYKAKQNGRNRIVTSTCNPAL